MRPLQNAAILFDLDGTLVDTAPDLAGAMNAVLQAEGRESLETDSVRALVGRGARALLERGFAETGAPAPEEALPGLVAQFLEHYRAHICDTSVAYPHARETLDGLLADGARLAVCTNKPEGLAEQLLAELNIRDAFASMIGADTLPVRKPDPEPLREAARRAGGHPDQTLLVGDSDTDRNTARAAGVPPVLVTFGPAGGDMAALEPEALLDDYAALPAVVASLIGAAS